jgi:predicted dehydrogenase
MTSTVTTPVRVAILGTGEWARAYHFPSLQALADAVPVTIAGIWNRTAASAEQAAQQFGITRVYRSLDEVVGDDGVDAFIVLVSSAALAGIVARLLPRRLPIFTEKPTGGSYQEALMLADLVDVPNVVAFNRRYMPINRRFKELADGMTGTYFAECHFYRNERRYDHFVMETGVHGINYMEYLCGPVRAIRTDKHTMMQNDFWISSVSFESGMQGIFKFFPCSGSNIERYEVHAENKSIYLHCPQTYTTDHPGRIVVHEGGMSVADIQDEEGEATLASVGLLDEYRDFFRALKDGSATASNFRNACNTMRVAEAIEEPANNGREIVFSS